MTTPAPALTSQQAAALSVNEGVYLVTAPPGSGKTEVLVRRIGRLLEESAGETFRILALTFTTRAAEKLSSRIDAEIADEAWRLTAGTFHHFCLDILRSYGELVGVPSDVTVFADLADRVELLLHGLGEDGYDPRGLDLDDAGLRRVLAEIDLLRTRLVPPDAAPDRLVEGTRAPLPAAYGAYERGLEHVGGIDFPGMLARAQRLLAESEWTARHYRSMYRYILIDEGQDLNLAQYEVLRALCGDEHRNVFMVADENQSIFGFNGASMRFVSQFEADFEGRRLSLDSNFRCAREIVALANRLAGQLSGETSVPSMSAGCEAKGQVAAWVADDEESEASAVAGWVEELLAEGLDASCLVPGEPAGLRAEDVAVIGRTRYAFEAVADALRGRGCPFALRTGEARLFDSVVWRRTYSVLRVLANPRDFPARQRLWMESAGDGTNDPGDAPDAVTDLLEAALERDAHMGGLAEPLRERAVGALGDGQLIERLLAAAPPADFGEDGVAVWLADQAELARCWERQVGTSSVGDAGLPRFLATLSKLQRVTLDEDGVRLLTVHVAKGLEFRAVVLVGMNQGTFPHYRSLEDETALNEERRNAYVAVTRASRALVLSRPAVRNTRFGPRRQDRSQCLDEMSVDEKPA